MRIWGYIFIFLNLVAAGAFVYFATSVWKARTEWQLAAVRQQLAIDGLPLDAVPPPSDPRDLNDDSVPFELQVGETRITQIKTSILKNAVPRGGKPLGTDQLIKDQTEEVKRVETLVFKSFAAEKVKIGDTEVDLLTDEKRQRLAVTLISLAKGMGRMGVYALYRDLAVEGRYEQARSDLAYLGRTGPQVEALRALASIGFVQEAITRSLGPDIVQRRAFDARVAIAVWLLREIPLAAPSPFKSPNNPAPADSPEAKEAKSDLEIIQGKLKPLLDPDEDNADGEDFLVSPEVRQLIEEYNKGRPKDQEMKPDEKIRLKRQPKGLLFKFSTKPARAQEIREQVDAAAKVLRDQVDADTGVKGKAAKTLVPFLAYLAGNPVDTKEKLDEAKKHLLELLALRATSDSESRAYTAVAEILFAPRPYNGESDEVKAQREKNMDAAGLETLRAYFEEAAAASSTTEKLDENPAQARAKIAGLKLLRDPDKKRADIAHLLYHLDGYLALVYEDKSDKGVITRHLAPIAPATGTSRVRWFKLMFPAIVEKDPDDDTLSDEEKKEATTALDSLYAQRAEWHQRVAAVVGLTAYVKAAEAQATELRQIAERLKPRIEEEQNYFMKNRQDLIYWLVGLNQVLAKRRDDDKRQADLKNTEQQEVDLRIGERIAYEKDLRKAQGDAKAPSYDKTTGKPNDAKTALLELEKKVDELFKVTKKLGEAQDALLGLELQLRDIELGRKKK